MNSAPEDLSYAWSISFIKRSRSNILGEIATPINQQLIYARKAFAPIVLTQRGFTVSIYLEGYVKCQSINPSAN